MKTPNVIRALLALCVFALLALPVGAQPIPLPSGFTWSPAVPANFGGAGLGFQNSAVPKMSGWTEICHAASEKALLCAATDYMGGVSTVRAEAEYSIVGYKGCIALGKGGPGGAIGDGGSFGGSFDFGGTIGCKPPGAIGAKYPGLVAVFSGSWQKNNVDQLNEVGGLKRFASQTLWRFGLGYTW